MNIQQFFISKFGKDTLWLILGQTIAMGSALFLNLFIGFKYGTALLGVFNQSLAYYVILSILFAMGLNNTLIKKLSEKSKNGNEEDKIFTANIITTLSISSSLSLFVMLIIYFYPNLLASDNLVKTLPIMLLALPLFCINKNFGAYYSGNRKQRNVAFQKIYRWGGLAIMFYIGGAYEYSINDLMASFICVEGTLAFLNIILNVKHFNFRISSKMIKDSIQFGMGSYVSEITSTFNSSIDIILVAYFLSDQEAGQYSFIAFIVRTLYIFPGILMQNISPIISHHWVKKTISELNSKLKNIRQINLIVLTFQFLALLVFYNLVILEIKDGFENTFGSFVIAMLGTFLFAQISWGGSILIMTDKLKANFYRTLIVLILNIIICSLFTYTFGFMGGMLAISINAFLSFFLLKNFVRRKTGVRLL